ncbi:MAG: 2-amino-4-hydroxy-6-hydroxymethyldihydropteridine diphosphokinase [Halobacteriovoraceae bacterium]|nr:2-amino-4-hydroxy-6-hydroxymethyldihydropteridine diphosphokinase [Halobacteriovoraceae bacterium]
MSLIIATGSNLKDKRLNLLQARKYLLEKFEIIAESRVYQSEAVDFIDQPSFYNQVFEFKIPSLTPMEVLKACLQIENKLGRIREQDKGPRIIDIDLIFWGHEKIKNKELELPHPRCGQRSFVIRPLSELPFFNTLSLEKASLIFDTEAKPL